MEISSNSNGNLVLHAIPADSGTALLEALNRFDDDFAAVLKDAQSDPMPMQERAWWSATPRNSGAVCSESDSFLSTFDKG